MTDATLSTAIRPDDTVACECQNCDWIGPADELDAIDDIGERVAAGEPMPAGQCPECGALAHATDKKLYTVCVAFYDADSRATLNIPAKSYAEACEIAIQKVDDGEVETQTESWDPTPTFVYGVVEGFDGEPFDGTANVPFEHSEDGVLHPDTPIRKALKAAHALHKTEPCAANLPLFERMTAALEELERRAAAPPKPQPITIHVATVEHRHGTNAYVGRTLAEAEGKVADYCFEWAEREGVELHEDWPNSEVLTAYFEKVNDESVTFAEDILGAEG